MQEGIAKQMGIAKGIAYASFQFSKQYFTIVVCSLCVILSSEPSSKGVYTYHSLQFCSMNHSKSSTRAQSAERRAHSVKRNNHPVGASSACDETYARDLSYRNEDIAPTYRPKRSALCALRFATVSLTIRKPCGIVPKIRVITQLPGNWQFVFLAIE
jgi:hypothetical protein